MNKTEIIVLLKQYIKQRWEIARDQNAKYELELFNDFVDELWEEEDARKVIKRFDWFPVQYDS